nr:hypothetical protein [uncultured organism]
MSKHALLSLLLLLPSAANASSTGAWAKLAAEAKARCSAESRLLRPSTSAPLVFSDDNGQVALLVTGAFPQRGLRGVQGSYLCLYDRRTGKAEVQEAKGWRAR